MFGVLAADRMFELFAVRSDAEMHKKQARRAKRLREKMTRESERVGGPQLATAVEMAGNEDAGPVVCVFIFFIFYFSFTRAFHRVLGIKQLFQKEFQ